MAISPSGRFSWQASASGKTADNKSSARMRWIGGGTFFPLRKRSKAKARPASQRQRAVKSGETSTARWRWEDRKSTRLNSSHGSISYAVFCLKKKKKKRTHIEYGSQCLYERAKEEVIT